MNTLLKWKKANPISIEHTHHNPFMSLQQEVDNAFRDFYNIFSTNRQNADQFENLTLIPFMDVVEDDNKYTVQMEMPGMDEKDIKVSFADNMLHVSGEKTVFDKNENKKYLTREIGFGKFERSFSIPLSLDVDKAKASFKKGMLFIEIPKKEESKQKARDIKVDRA